MQTKEKRENWLLIKEHDAFEEEDEDGSHASACYTQA